MQTLKNAQTKSQPMNVLSAKFRLNENDAYEKLFELISKLVVTLK